MEAAATHIKKYPKECVPVPYFQFPSAPSYALEYCTQKGSVYEQFHLTFRLWGSLREEDLASCMHYINIWKDNHFLTTERETKLCAAIFMITYLYVDIPKDIYVYLS